VATLADVGFEEGDKVFWDVKRGERLIVVTVEDNKYAQLVIGVENPEEVIKMIEAVINIKNT